MTRAEQPTALEDLIADLAESRHERAVMREALRLLAFAAPSAPPPPALRERVTGAAAERYQLPAFEAGGSFFARAAQFDWVTIAPGVEIKDLYRDPASGARTTLVRMAPNMPFPPHPHGGIEDLYLIEGDAWVGDVPMRAGDYCRAPAGTHHNDVRSGPSGALSFVVSR
jgi:anti-sigma factor ChrR (cupin superfamily)